ncbi:MAG: DUF3499 family protein [Actinobacteria bacterium]|nr:DUF3499 family protein [Actinomycetota bacterium]
MEAHIAHERYSWSVTKSCERPGCSEPGVVASTFERESLTVVLSHYVGEVEEGSFNVMCTRHADILTVPRGWTIDDRREDPPRLFAAPGKKSSKPEKSKDQTSSMSRRRKARSVPSPKLFDQIALVTKLETASPVVEEEAPQVEAVVEEPVARVEETEEKVDQDATKAWKPQFDRTDDLGGVLRPKGKLLSRAFGLDDTVAQPRPEPTDGLEREPFTEHDIP